MKIKFLLILLLLIILSGLAAWKTIPYLIHHSSSKNNNQQSIYLDDNLNYHKMRPTDLWDVVSDDQNALNESIMLNDFSFKWKKIRYTNIHNTGADKLSDGNILFLNQESPYLLHEFGITEKNIISNGGIKAVFEYGKQTIVYIAVIEGDCATAKLMSLENKKILFQFECLPKDSVDLNGVGGAVYQLSDNEFLLSTGTPTTLHVENQINMMAQDDNSYWGKILKIRFEANNLKVSVFSKGHRNPQGIAKINGKLYAVEHGPRGGDEINLLTEGKNYGWPLQSFGSEYDLTKINKVTNDIIDYQIPLYVFMPSIGISYIAECPINYANYYAPMNCMAVSSLRRGAIFLIIFNNDKVLFTETLDFGSRIRKFFVSRNEIYAVTDFDGVIMGKKIELLNQ